MRRFENINKYGLKPVNDANEKYALQLHRKIKIININMSHVSTD